MKNHKKKVISFIAVVCSLAAASSAFAFNDLSGTQQQVVEALKSKGIVNGVTKDTFVPSRTLKVAEGVQLAVKAMGLEAKPDVSEASYGNIPADAWYAQAFQIAAQNGLPVSGDMNPASAMTREQFADMLYAAIQTTGEYPVIKMYIETADDKDIDADSLDAVQFLLLTKIASLDEKQNFYPDRGITRIEAAEMVYNAVEYVGKMQETQPTEPQPQPEQPESGQDQVTMSIEPVSSTKNKVTLTRNEAPNPGYGIAVDRVDYVSDTEAVIYYKLLSPAPGEMNIQVITDTTTSVELDSKYEKVSIKPADSSADTSSVHLQP
ncbi:protease complex subunit PrcB family protein [Paenibacillus sp. P96]|uniref:Protease complex subunit PrcB family protein n=1 Tax=Paenibacillus zeirhizosphaerae TaxID=2987519 RepID=A0ABT9FRT9_9BACL|nr:protease complex subunit PrcB family protein [Paenibacillus sp. P96]MDP4097442.1 protease complex subunit PrcB family protein [Paenibacillus sp. P96]